MRGDARHPIVDHHNAMWPWIGLAITIVVLALTFVTVWWTGNW